MISNPKEGRPLGITALCCVRKPGLSHASATAPQRQVAGRLRPGVEVLVVPSLGRRGHGIWLPVHPGRLVPFLPQQRVSLATEDDDMGPGPVAVALLVGADIEFREVATYFAPIEPSGIGLLWIGARRSVLPPKFFCSTDKFRLWLGL